jgi:squalene-associated FAD-dependent desaturase
LGCSVVDVCVVGAGFAGLSAAVRLSELGARVRVVEARRRAGGRATAFRDPATGEWVDNGQHLMLGCYRETLRFLATIGAADRVAIQPRLQVQFVDTNGRPSTLDCPRLPSPLHLLGGLFAWDALGVRDRLSALRLLPALSRAGADLRHGRGAAARPDETVEEWLVRHGQSPRLREMLWEPLAIAALNQPPASAAARYFAQVLAQMLSSGASGSAIVTPVRPLHEVYVDPAIAWLEDRGAEVLTATPARVAIEGGRAARVETPTGSFEARAIVLAVAWHALPSTITGERFRVAGILDSAAGTAPSPIVTVNLWVEGPPIRSPLVGLPGRTVQWVFDKRRIFGNGCRHLSLVCSAADAIVARSNEEAAELAVREVRAALPELRESEIERITVVRERRATFSLAPGQPRRPGTRTSVEGLFLAGDWIDTGLPGTIESAVVSGCRAAEAVAHGPLDVEVPT